MPPQPSSPCPLLTSSYQTLLSLREEFRNELKEAVKSGDFSKLDSLKQDIEKHRGIIEENLIPFEKELNIKEQYEKQKNTLQKLCLLESKEGKLGITAIDNTFYPFPTLREVSKRLRENKELLSKKIEQGFGRLQITPFGLPFSKFKETMQKAILEHYQKGKLFSRNPDGTRVSLDLDTETPFDIWDGYENEEIRYFPEAFDPKKHGGRTKQELLETGDIFHILFLEQDLTIQRKTKETPNEYLNLLKSDPQYQGEQGLTMEDWMTLFLTHLETTDEVIDDTQGKGFVSWNLGTYFPASGGVLRARWNRSGRRAGVAWYGPSLRGSGFGCRGAVRV